MGLVPFRRWMDFRVITTPSWTDVSEWVVVVSSPCPTMSLLLLVHLEQVDPAMVVDKHPASATLRNGAVDRSAIPRNRMISIRPALLMNLCGVMRPFSQFAASLQSFRLRSQICPPVPRWCQGFQAGFHALTLPNPDGRAEKRFSSCPVRGWTRCVRSVHRYSGTSWKFSDAGDLRQLVIDCIIFPAMPANTQNNQNNRKIVSPMTSGTIFVYIAIPIQRTKGAMLKGKSAHVPDLPYKEAVAEPERTQRLWDAIQAQDTPPGTRLKLLKMMPGGQNAKEEVFRLIQEGIVAEHDILERLASEPVAGNA